jgi:threonine dehydrogenase-like Zn-dependent dehydrogenase
VIQPVVGCGVCRWCQSGRPNICPRRQLIGAHRPGAFAEYVTVPARVVYHLPDSLSDLDGALVEPLGNAMHMLDLAGRIVYRDVVILGAGTLGLLTAAAARLAGARHVVVTDTQAHRLAVAEQLGADITLNGLDDDTPRRIEEITDGGADIVIEAVGVTATRRQAIETAAPGGTVVLLGNAELESELPVLDVVNREITLQGSYSCTDEEFRRAIEILADGRIDTDSWVRTATLDQGPGYFERLVSDPGELVKIVFQL